MSPREMHVGRKTIGWEKAQLVDNLGPIYPTERYTRLTITFVDFSGIRFTHLRLQRRNLFDHRGNSGSGTLEMAGLGFPTTLFTAS
jgi:hypothetical protein